MFNLQGSEIIIVLLLALVVLGPEKLPDAMRKMGQAYAELKKMSSGFQSEFRAAVEEPLREVRETANVLRDSTDFTKLQHGQRPEKPKSGEMAPLAPADPDAVPSDDTPTFETGPGHADGPELAAESKPAPYADSPDGSSDDSSDDSSEAPSVSAPRRPPVGPSPVPAPPPPFTAMSAPPPADHESGTEPDDEGSEPPIGDDTAGNTAGSPATGAGEPSGGDPQSDGDTAPSDDEADTSR